MKHSDLLDFIINSLETDAYDFGAFIELNGLDINFSPIDCAKKYFTLHAISDGEITLYIPSSYNANSLAYSLDGKIWSTFNSNTTFSVNTDDIIIVKCVTNAYTRGISNPMFSSTCDYEVYGNAMSLLYGDDFEGQTTLTTQYSLRALFYNQRNLKNAENLILPATTLALNCYQYMFQGCTSLTTAPKLPATTLANYCYSNMFNGCTSLTTAPKLPATTLADSCYTNMFNGCTSLTTAPQLPATTLANYCYQNMFNGCTSLTTAPELPATTLTQSCYQNMFRDCTSLTTALELPATTLANYCYYSMFEGCTSLTEAPQLPATTLANYCYQYMFQNCKSLTTAPQLPATTLANYCYQNMFNGCTSLTTAPELPATTLTQSCYYSMFEGCTSLTTALELPATTLANYCYYSMFKGCTNLTEAPQLPATTLANACYISMFSGCTSLTEAPQLPATTLASSCYTDMFNGCSNLNYIKMLATDISASNCLFNWVYRVASHGTFVKNTNMTSLPTGASGIPIGWTVENHITSFIINKTNENITFYYNNGLFTPSSTVTEPLTNYYSQTQLLSFKPNCDIIVDIANTKNYTWENNKTLQDVINALNITNISKLGITITQVIIKENDSNSYYGYGETYKWNGETVIDLGLPSGTLWATCNVGASTPWEDGNYYAYGETKPKTTYNSSTYTYTGKTDTLPLENDAAYVNMGSGYHTPTREQCQELIDNTISSWVNINGRSGNWFKSKINGKSIFIPASGIYVNNFISEVNERTNVLLSTTFFNSANDRLNYYLGGMYGNIDIHADNPCYGKTVRAVFK
jgi:hypothetical protein